jgi:4,5-DOPA dioxygenase extradiol
MSTTMPSIFVSHGAPTLYEQPQPTRDFLMGLGQKLPRPEAVLCVSAHWTTPAPRVSSTKAPSTMHDFGGFSQSLFSVRYPAPGDPALARRVAALLGQEGLAVDDDPDRGLDHGAWVPLGLMYPKADVPVTQVSVAPGRCAGCGQRLRHP